MPDPTDAETLAEVLRRADDEALTRTNFEQIAATYEETARAILASDWLAARIEQARAGETALREAQAKAWDKGASEALRLHDRHKAWLLTNPYRAALDTTGSTP